MSGMFCANHGAMGFFSNRRRLRSRNCVIHLGSPFHHEIWSTTGLLRPFSGLNAYSTSSLQPSEYLLRSRSKEVTVAPKCQNADPGGGAEFPLPP
ncbi:unannotated protein [freshwater metagenome]|uniref:Unannotated protein n=1 Tax=freshwater metagenome TaxID=449393 RepID=A0A6J6FZH6_9ZZZZ